jgi:hypothetical protein
LRAPSSLFLILKMAHLNSRMVGKHTLLFQRLSIEQAYKQNS